MIPTMTAQMLNTDNDIWFLKLKVRWKSTTRHLGNNSYDMRIFVNMNCVFHSLSETQLQFIIHFEYSILDFSVDQLLDFKWK